SEHIRLSSLATEAGLSPFHFQRAFKAIVGVTPRQYVEALRLKKLKDNLRRCKDVTEAVYNSGFQSASRVYESANSRLGMTPNQYRKGGKGVAMSYATIATCLGTMMVAATNRGISFVQFADCEADLLKMLQTEYPNAELRPKAEDCRDDFS